MGGGCVWIEFLIRPGVRLLIQVLAEFGAAAVVACVFA